MDGYRSLLKSRKVLIALVAVVNTIIGHYYPQVPPEVTDSINQFALVVIAAITAEDVAAKLKTGTAKG